MLQEPYAVQLKLLYGIDFKVQEGKSRMGLEVHQGGVKKVNFLE